MQTSPLSQSALLLHRLLSQLACRNFTHLLLPFTVSAQRQPAWPAAHELVGHLLLLIARCPSGQPCAASASTPPATPGSKAITPPPRIAAPTSFSARRREMVPLASPFASTSKDNSSVVSSVVESTLTSLSSVDIESPPFRPASQG